VRLQAEHEALQQARRDQETAAWKARYAKRAGIEGTLLQAIRAFGLRQCRYIGYAKARLQHSATATALNFVRLDAWLCGEPRAQTRCSSFAKLQPKVV
jgi:transposase